MRTLTLLLGAVVLTASTSASAQSSAAAAEQLYRDANTLQRQGKVHEACLKFVESEKLDAQLGTLLNIASCHEKEGKVAAAWSDYSELVDQATKKGDKKRATYAARKVAALDKQLPRVQLSVPAGTAELRVDGVVMGQRAWSSAIPVDPGAHEVAYSAPGKQAGTQQFTATAGTTAKVVLPPLQDEVVVPVPVAALPLAPPPLSLPPPEGEPTTQGSPLRTAGYVVGGVGIVGLGLGAVFGGLALSSKGSVNGACKGNQCSQTGLDDVSSARSQATVSTVGLIAGGVCLAAGVTLVIVGGKRGTTVGFVPLTTDHGAGLATVGTF